MPLYLSQPDRDTPEPWRHGMAVYSAPFQIDADQNPRQPEGGPVPPPRPLRRLRHGEIVLVDDVCVAWETFWLRLRWPGHKGGFAGYVPLQKSIDDAPKPPATDDGEELPNDLTGKILRVESLEDRGGTDEADLDDPAREETASMPSADPADASGAALTCLRTGLAFPTADDLKLLQIYDDGITPPVAINPINTEPVFCRICREGLHEDADDEQPEAEKDEGTNRGDNTTRVSGGLVASRQASNDDIGDDDAEEIPLETNRMLRVDPNDPTTALVEPPSEANDKGPVMPHPIYSANPRAMENPLMAPCECSGSMAFVHYLCVEEWRCRSRHPAARNGLNCETCGTAYKLPPPSARPAHVMNAMDDDMMAAMPPHVMEALRRPHVWWRIGAAIVRRRWLRPLAPIFMSPLVSLYCRARRMLKKRGVARRRWACSLCRRRARWKCVRCLRSYYCSRQCQNVSWHIVHKHLCYKPVRLFWSIIAYGTATVLLFPGIVWDPLMYDLGVVFIPISFVVSAVLAGSFATLLKKSSGYDIRGRLLELTVVTATSWLSLLSWGLVSAFFGEPEACYGVFGDITLTKEMQESSWLLWATKYALLEPTMRYYSAWDSALAMSWGWIKALICTPGATGCFAHVPSTETIDFYLQSGSCGSDWLFFIYLYIAAVVAFVLSWLYKIHERRLRQQQRAVQNREDRLRRRQARAVMGQGRPHFD